MIVPNHQRWHAKWKLRWNILYTHCIHVFARLAPICMLSRCLSTKISASELRRKFIKSALLVGLAAAAPANSTLISQTCPGPPKTNMFKKSEKKEEAAVDFPDVFVSREKKRERILWKSVLPIPRMRQKGRWRSRPSPCIFFSWVRASK